MPLKVFYCYAREDQMLRGTLEKHLATLKRQELIVDWHDRNIDVGKEWAKEIDRNMGMADIILLLISPDFVHSDYCYSIEMKRALERHDNGTARVIPIILRHVDFEGEPFSKLQSLPTDTVPVTDRKWQNQDEAFFDIAQGIRKVVGELLSHQLVSEGEVYFYRQQYEEALNIFERAVCFDANNVHAHIGKGQALNELASQNINPFSDDGKYQQALDVFTQAINLDSTFVNAYIGKGNALLGMADYLFSSTLINKHKGKIFDAFKQAIRLDPKNEAAYIGQGNAFMYFGDCVASVSAFSKAIELARFPNRDTYRRMADALYKLKRYKEALSAYETCIKLSVQEQDADLYKSVGEVLSNLGRYVEALRAYEKALFLSSNSGEVYMSKGDVLYCLNRYEEALQAFDQALKLLPAYEKVKRAKAHRGKVYVWQALAQLGSKEADKLDPPEVSLDEDDGGLGEIDDHPF